MTNNKYLAEIPKTYTVSYFNEAEWNKDLTTEQIKQQEIIATYQAQSETKGYGPCSWNNPYCSCYISQGFAPLKVACPAVGCSSRNATSWFHSSSGYLLASDQSGCGTLLVSGQGHIKCANCGTTDNLVNWKFKCSNSCHLGYYRETSSESFANALSFAGDVIRNSDSTSRDIMRQLINYLFDC